MKITKNLEVVALLPMKAHSERVKGKNFRDFCGKPLFCWILDTLLAVEHIELVVINTDARDILESSGFMDSPKILVRDRKPEICGDLVSMNRVLEDDIENINSSIYLMTHTTNPFLSSATITNAIQEFRRAEREVGADSLFTVDKVQSRFYREDGTPVNHDPDNLVRTQDLEPWYEENSNLYIFSRASFKATQARIGGAPVMYETPKLESIDIDTPEDWEFAVAAASFHAKNR